MDTSENELSHKATHQRCSDRTNKSMLSMTQENKDILLKLLKQHKELGISEQIDYEKLRAMPPFLLEFQGFVDYERMRSQSDLDSSSYHNARSNTRRKAMVYEGGF